MQEADIQAVRLVVQDVLMVVLQLLLSIHVIVMVVQEADMHQVRLAAADVLMVKHRHLLLVAPIAFTSAATVTTPTAKATIGRIAVRVVTTVAPLLSLVVSPLVLPTVAATAVL